jgi:cellulose biosynthesis protein BcsQ
MQVAPEGELRWNYRQPNQSTLWGSWIKLGEKFYSAIVAAPVPVDMRALKALKRSPLALDLYAWLTYEAYRANRNNKPRFVSWENLHEQFGAEYSRITDFQQKARAALAKIRAVYPGLVLAIDNDPQGSLTILFGHDHNKLKKEKTLYFSLVGERPLAELAIGENPKLIPANETLAGAESEFATNLLLNGVNAMRDRVQEVRGEYDFILIDCLPSLGVLCLGALVASDYVPVPVETNNLSFRGVEMLFKNVAKIQARLNPKLSVLGVLPTKYNPRYTHDNEVLSVVRDRLAAQHIRLFDPINRSTAFDKSSVEGKPALDISPNVQGAQAYEKLADEIAGL